MEETKKILIVGINESVHTTKKVIEEVRLRGVEYEFIKWGSLVFFEDGIFFEKKSIKLKEFDAIFCDIPSYKLYLSKQNKQDSLYFRLYNELHELCRQARDLKVPLMNKNFVLENPFYNKFTQAQIFSKNQIEAIPTLHLTDNKLTKIKKSTEAFNIGYPLVVKQSEGGMGQAVWMAKDEKELEEIISTKRNQSLIYQPFIENDCDFRVLVIGAKALGIMKRVAKTGEWKNNFALGGTVESFCDDEMKKFSERVAEKMGLDYVGLDIFKIGNDYKVIEANVFACFEGFEEAFPEINVAAQILNCLNI